jgi:hypothetical protein
MRALRRPAVGLLLAAGIVGAGIAINAPSGYAVDDTSLTVSPDQGGPDAQFTVVYRWPAANARKHSTARACMPGQITFEWDGSSLGRAPATLAGGSCAATLRAAPPPGAYHGTAAHTISVTNDASARATYTVTERPAGTPSAGTPDSATDSAVDPPAILPATPPGAAGSTALADGQQGAGDGTAWLIAIGVVLALTGAGVFGVVVWRTRHPKPDAEAPWLLADDNTQPIAVRPAAHRARRRLGLRTPAKPHGTRR